MGWRDRDWAKFTEDEWADFLGKHRPSSPVSPRRARGVGRRRQRVGEWTLAVLVGTGVLAFAYDHFERGPTVRSIALRPVIPLVTRPPRIATVVEPPTSNVIAIRWRARDLAPAPQAGQICVTDVRHGRICASYVIGQRPADTLTRQLGAMGLRVESTGSG